MRQRSLAVAALAGSAMFIASLTVFWFVWAAADAVPTAHPAAWPRMAFLAVSFPVFSVATKSFSTQHFWQLAILNSFVWAFAAGLASWKATAR